MQIDWAQLEGVWQVRENRGQRVWRWWQGSQCRGRPTVCCWALTDSGVLLVSLFPYLIMLRMRRRQNPRGGTKNSFSYTDILAHMTYASRFLKVNVGLMERGALSATSLVQYFVSSSSLMNVVTPCWTNLLWLLTVANWLNPPSM